MSCLFTFLRALKCGAFDWTPNLIPARAVKLAACDQAGSELRSDDLFGERGTTKESVGTLACCYMFTVCKCDELQITEMHMPVSVVCS